MSLNHILATMLNPGQPNQIAGSKPKQLAEAGSLRWGCYRVKTFANLTPQVPDVPNATVSISLGPSMGWVDQLAGITGHLKLATGQEIAAKFGVNEIVGAGFVSHGAKHLAMQQTVLCPFGGFEQGYISAGYLDSVILLGDVGQITTVVEPVDAATLTQLAVAQECSLSAKLRRLRKLEDDWDGESSVRVSDETTTTAEEIIKEVLHVALSHLVISTVRLGPLPDGSVRFECTHSNKELFLTVSGKVVEIQTWQPLESIEALGYWKTNVASTREHLEWLVK